MRSLRAILILSVLELAFGTASSWAACGLTLTAGNVSINWSLSFSTQAISFTLQKAQAATCDFWIGFTKGGGASSANRRMTSGGNQLPYQLYKDNAYTKVLKDASDGAITSVDEVITGSFLAGTNLTQTLNYFVDIPANGSTTPTLVKDGSYTDTYTINVYEGSDPTAANPIPVTSAAITITTVVPKLINMSMVATGGAFDSFATSKNIDFGSLTPGASQSFDLRVRTNAGFSVTFSSGNNGVMRKLGQVGGSGVPYSLYANGALLDLSSSAAVPVVGLTASGQTSLEGLGYPIRFVIGSFSSSALVSGTVRDIITVTATTTE